MPRVADATLPVIESAKEEAVDTGWEVQSQESPEPKGIRFPNIISSTKNTSLVIQDREANENNRRDQFNKLPLVDPKYSSI